MRNPFIPHIIDCAHLFLPRYSESVLRDCPDSVDDVMVEADGEWHTSDNKFGSASWKIKHPPKQPNAAARKPVSSVKALVSETSASSSTGPNGTKKPDVEITVLDSDDEDEGRVKRELSPSFGNISSGSQSQSSVPYPRAGDVIDLTIDSDDDEPPPRNSGKRKASEAVSPTEGIWKKARTSDSFSTDSSATPVTLPITAMRPAVPVLAPGTVRLTSTFNSSPPSAAAPTTLPPFHAAFSGRPPPINGFSSSRGGSSSNSSNARWG